MVNQSPSIESDEILRPLSESEIEELEKLYKNKYGNRNFHYLLIYNQLKWNRQLSELSAKELKDTEKWRSFRKSFYTHKNCDFRKYGTYVSLHFDLMQSVSFHSWEPDLKELFECISQTSLIDWKSGPLLTNVDLHYCQQVKEIATKMKGVTVQRARLCHGMILGHKKAMKLQLPPVPVPGYSMRRLQNENAKQIHDLWVNNKEGSLPYIEGLIQLNQTLGIFKDSDNSLVAWIFQNDFSGLGILQVQPEERRKGFGYLLTMHLSAQIAKMEQVEISVWILVENYRSEALLEKVGFEKSVLNEWIQLK